MNIEIFFGRHEEFQKLLIRGFLHMTQALDRLTASVSALTDQVDANDTELSSLADEIRSMTASNVTDDQLNALADKLDASRSNLKTAADAAADALENHQNDTTTAPAGGDTTVAGQPGDDSVNGGNGDDTINA